MSTLGKTSKHAFANRIRLSSIALLAILLVAVALRLYHLGDKGLWGDEIAVARWSLFSLSKLWSQFRDPPDFVLDLLLIHFAQKLGTTEFWIRLPSALTSIVIVPISYVAARRMFGDFVALVAAFLLAISPEQIWYAQDARAYAPEALYATIAFYFLIRLASAPNWRALVGLVVANLLGAYNHLFGFIPLLIQGTAALSLALVWLVQSVRTQEMSLAKVLTNFPRAPLVLALALVITLILMLPLLNGTIPYLQHPISTDPIEASFQTAHFHLTPAFLNGLLTDFGLGSDGGWRTYATLVFAITGLVVLLLRSRRFALLVFLWLSVPLLLLQITQPNHTVANRYLLFMQPLYLILCAGGLIAIVQVLFNWITRLSFPAKHPALSPERFVTLPFLVILLVAGIPPLQALYARAKLNDWKTLASYIYAHAEPGDMLISQDGYWAVRALSYYLPNLNRYSSPPGTLQSLQAALRQHRRIWYVAFGDTATRDERNWVAQNLEQIAPADWQRADLDYTARDGFTFTEAEEPAILYRHDDMLPAQIQYSDELGTHLDDRPYFPLQAGEAMEAKLRLDTATPRELQIKYSSRVKPNFIILVGENELAQVQETQIQDDWQILRFKIPDEQPQDILVSVQNKGTNTLLVRSIGLHAVTGN